MDTASVTVLTFNSSTAGMSTRSFSTLAQRSFLHFGFCCCQKQTISLCFYCYCDKIFDFYFHCLECFSSLYTTFTCVGQRLISDRSLSLSLQVSVQLPSGAVPALLPVRLLHLHRRDEPGWFSGGRVSSRLPPVWSRHPLPHHPQEQEVLRAGGAAGLHPEEGGGHRLHLPHHPPRQQDLQRGGWHGDGHLAADRPGQHKGRGQEPHTGCHPLQEVLCQQGSALQTVQVITFIIDYHQHHLDPHRRYLRNHHHRHCMLSWPLRWDCGVIVSTIKQIGLQRQTIFAAMASFSSSTLRNLQVAIFL